MVTRQPPLQGVNGWRVFVEGAVGGLSLTFHLCSEERKAILLVCRRGLPTVKAGEFGPGLT